MKPLVTTVSFPCLDTGKTCYAVGPALPPAPSEGEGTVAAEGERSKIKTESEEEDQYLVKWVGWSHLHNTWETGEYMTSLATGWLFCGRLWVTLASLGVISVHWTMVAHEKNRPPARDT